MILPESMGFGTEPFAKELRSWVVVVEELTNANFLGRMIKQSADCEFIWFKKFSNDVEVLCSSPKRSLKDLERGKYAKSKMPRPEPKHEEAPFSEELLENSSIDRAPFVVCHRLVRIHIKAMEVGEHLWNVWQLIPSLLHLYNTLHQLGLLEIPVLEAMCDMLTQSDLFGHVKQRPDWDFAASYGVLLGEAPEKQEITTGRTSVSKRCQIILKSPLTLFSAHLDIVFDTTQGKPPPSV